MPQTMRCNLIFYAGYYAIFSYYFPETLTADRFSSGIKEKMGGRPAFQQVLPGLGKIVPGDFEGLSGTPAGSGGLRWGRELPPWG